MSSASEQAMTADTTIQPDDFESRVEQIVTRVLARQKPRPARATPDREHERERETMLAERAIRVEEALKHQREVMIQGFAQSDKHFEQVDKRFEQVDKRFEEMLAESNRRFEEMRQDMDKRFTQVDKRFEQVDKRLDHQLDVLKWSVGLLVTLFIGLTTFLKLAV